MPVGVDSYGFPKIGPAVPSFQKTSSVRRRCFVSSFFFQPHLSSLAHILPNLTIGRIWAKEARTNNQRRVGRTAIRLEGVYENGARSIKNSKIREVQMEKPDEKVVKPGGDIVASIAADFRQDLLKEVKSGVKRLVVDLNDVEMVDSVGIGVLVAAHNSLSKNGGQMTVSNVSQDIFNLFKIMRLDQHFEVIPAAG
jgi:anti-anti-sigma factor